MTFLPFTALDRDLFKCKRVDLGLVVDTTGSIQLKNVPYLRRSLKQLIDGFDISEEGTHVSFETFANHSKLHNTFKDEHFHDNKVMRKLIQNSIQELTMPTRLDRALVTADQEMFTKENGDRAGVRSVMVLYTDGKSHPETKNFEPAVKSLKVRLRSRGTGYSSVCIYVCTKCDDYCRPTTREIFMKRSLKIFCFCLNNRT